MVQILKHGQFIAVFACESIDRCGLEAGKVGLFKNAVVVKLRVILVL